MCVIFQKKEEEKESFDSLRSVKRAVILFPETSFFWRTEEKMDYEALTAAVLWSLSSNRQCEGMERFGTP